MKKNYKYIFKIIRKEQMELWQSNDFIYYYIMLIFVSGIIIPLSSFNSLIDGNWYLNVFVFIIISIIIPSGLTADTFAGEKERKTLETLLSTPVPVIMIYLGKAFFIIAVTLIILIFGFICNIFTVNILYYLKYNTLNIFPYSGLAVFIIFITGLTISSFTSFIGVLISLKMERVRSANLITFFIGTPLMIPVFRPLMSADVTVSYMVILTFILFIINLILSIIVKKLFHRSWIINQL